MSKIGKNSRKKTFFLEGYKGAYNAGAFYRSGIAIDVNNFEQKFNANIVGMVLEAKEDSDKPSWTIEFFTETASSDVTKREEELNKEAEHQAGNNPDDGSWKGR
jgi:hypothetical protein